MSPGRLAAQSTVRTLRTASLTLIRSLTFFSFFPEDSLMMSKKGYLWYCGVVMSGEDAPRPYPEDLIVLEIKTNKQESLLVTERRAMMLI